LYPPSPLFNCYRRFLRFIRVAFAMVAAVECTEIRKRKTTTDDLLRMTIVNPIVGHRLQSVGRSTPIYYLLPYTGCCISRFALEKLVGETEMLLPWLLGTETISFDFFILHFLIV
jgi:hypothetical protein